MTAAEVSDRMEPTGTDEAGMRWHGHGTAERGVRERRFDVDRGARTIPGLLWTPDQGEGPWPLVLLGHGGSGSKRQDYVLSLARRLVRHHGLAAAAIDGPVHGDRRAGPPAATALVVAEFAQLWSSDGDEMTDDMVADWRATLDVLVSQPEIDAEAVGWWGVSMGTIIGLPVVAAEPRIRAAVLGLMGLTGPTRGRIERDAPHVRCPVLFLVQWDDEMFHRDTAIALWEALGATDKRLHAHPGGHGDLPGEEFEASAVFLAQRLGAKER
jgi:dienelactone hydrolase